MDVLIRGMEMPKDGEVTGVMIYPDGKVRYSFDWLSIRIATAVPVPPHGKLIDVDSTIADLKAMCEEACGTDNIPSLIELAIEYFTNVPTLIPASEEGE